jgi:hypothetical protein
MTSRRAVPGILLSVAMTCATSLCFAQSDFDRTTARTLGQEGHKALDQKDYTTAADRFSRADALVHAPTFLLGFAQAEVGLGKLVTALEAYNRILREGVPPKAPPPFVKALETARKEFDALQPRIPYVTIQVAGPAAANVKVTIDGTDVPRAALGVKRAVDPGQHAIVAVADGFAPANASFTIAESATQSVTLEPKPAPPGTVPPAPAGPATGAAPASGAPSSSPPESAPASGSNPRRIVGIAGMALGGAGLVVGAAMGGVVIAKHGSLLASCPGAKCPVSQASTLAPQVSQYHTFSTVSTAAFIAGGVVAVTGIVLFATAPKSSQPSVGVTMGPGWAGLQGSFR